MYFPIGWPKTVNISISKKTSRVNHVSCDAVKILVAAVGDDFLGIWYTNPLMPITFCHRSSDSVNSLGHNESIHWRPDSKKLAIITSRGILLIYELHFESNPADVLVQVDSSCPNLRRDSAELFMKDNVPCLRLKEVGKLSLESAITSLCCISLTEIILATSKCELIKTSWEDIQINDKIRTINLRKISFYLNQNTHLKNLPPIAKNAFVNAIEYSPFIGGYAAVFSDKRAAFLIEPNLKFEEKLMRGFWLPNVEDAMVCGVNHKFRLLAFGRMNSEVAVYSIEDTTGGPEYSHKLSLNTKVFPDLLGAVNEIKWSPDGCAVIISWDNGGFALWSTFGTMLMSSLNWDFGLHIDLTRNNPLIITKMEWSTEGYHLFLIRNTKKTNIKIESNLLVLSFVKSALSMNPCMTSNPHILLQGDDTLYLNQGDSLEKIYVGTKFAFPNNQTETETGNLVLQNENLEINKTVDISSILSQSKFWCILKLPYTYISTNWPIRYTAIDYNGLYVAVAGRTGLLYYSLIKKKWKLFGNESQEKEFVVSGGLLWWEGFIISGCYSLLDRTDEIRCYSQDCKLDNRFGNKIQVRAPVITLNILKDQLIVLTADGIVVLFILKKKDFSTVSFALTTQIDIKSICIHPACIVSLSVANLKTEATAKNFNMVDSLLETIIFNICGRILTIPLDSKSNAVNSLMATCLASCVECFWLSNAISKSPMRDCLWLYSGLHGMRVWLPIHPPKQEIHDTHRLHSFMSKRIMLSFRLKVYPLVILLDNVIVLGVENETTLYANEIEYIFALPYSFLERKSQVYLHKILRQLIKRNLGYSAWEFAKSYCALPYFSHSLELLLHEVLEKEATSKDPIPDALLPSVLDFIREFPLFMQTIVQCARKTEIALWPYLFSIAGKPKDLFQYCLRNMELETAASYLIILQNLEPSTVSKEFATVLLDISLESGKWDLAKDLIRFLKAIDPSELDSPQSSMIVNNKISPPNQSQSQVNSNPEVFNLILGPIARERSFSISAPSNVTKKSLKNVRDKSSNSRTSVPLRSATSGGSVQEKELVCNISYPVNSDKVRYKRLSKEKQEEFSIDTILQCHARKLLENCKLIELGYMSAFLDFHLVVWLIQEKEKSAKLNDFVRSLLIVHEQLKLPSPFTSRIKSNTKYEDTILIPKISLESYRNNLFKTQSYTSESGYFSVSSTEVGNFKTSTAYLNGIFLHDDGYHRLPFSPNHSSFEFEALNQSRKMLNDIHTSSESRGKLMSEKMEIKIRYLLQLFIEADCVDYALLLSILLMDAASIGRIIDGVIRSECIMSCYRIENALKKVTQWSFENNCSYRIFILNLQPHIYLLEQYLQIAKTTNRLDSINNSQQMQKIGSLENISNSASNVKSQTIQWPDKTSEFLKRQKKLDLHTENSLQSIDVFEKETEPERFENGLCLIM